MFRLGLEAYRPKQWIKNGLVLAAPLLSQTIFESPVFLRTLLVFIAFCCISSSMYLINDLQDQVADAKHHIKRLRPIASGRLPTVIAWKYAVFLGIISIIIGASASTRAFMVVSTYAAVTIAYSLSLKRVPLLELVIVSSGFVLRALAGAAAADVPPSRWFLACVLSGSLFIAIKKRFAEIAQKPIRVGSTRKVLEFYSSTSLRNAARFSALCFVLTYVGWALFVKSADDLGFVLRLLSILPLSGAALRYEIFSSRAEGEVPEDLFGSDRVLQALGLVWVVLVGASVYL